MKTINKILITTILVSFGQIAQAQINTKVSTKTAVNSKNILGNQNNTTKAIVSSKSNLKSLQTAKYTKKINPSSFSKLTISKADLARTSRKSNKITPMRPNTTYLGISYFGEYSKEAFVLNHRPRSADGKSYKYSGFVKFNAVRGKEYRIKIATDLKSRDPIYRAIGATKSGTVFIKIGGMEYSVELSAGQEEMNFIFTANIAGQVDIAISPLQLPVAAKSISLPPGLNPLGINPPVPTSPYNTNLSSYALAIKYIQIDEI